jgi:hypothetical protein
MLSQRLIRERLILALGSGTRLGILDLNRTRDALAFAFLAVVT